jgi:hypothetical protein
LPPYGGLLRTPPSPEINNGFLACIMFYEFP